MLHYCIVNILHQWFATWRVHPGKVVCLSYFPVALLFCYCVALLSSFITVLLICYIRGLLYRESILVKSYFCHISLMVALLFCYSVALLSCIVNILHQWFATWKVHPGKVVFLSYFPIALLFCYSVALLLHFRFVSSFAYEVCHKCNINEVMHSHIFCLG